MLAEQMRHLWEYNRWAWQRVFATVDQLSAETIREPRQFFWDSIHGLLVHGLTAEWIWLARSQGHSPDAILDPASYADFDAVRRQWATIDDDWEGFLRGLEDLDFQRVVHYKNTSGQTFSLSLVDIVQHVINHATEHRSQLTPVLYNLGRPTAALDYMLFRLSSGSSPEETGRR